MKITNEIINFIMGSIAGVLVWFFGKPDGFFKLLIALSVIDFMSGTFLAWMYGELSSRTGFKGIFKKCIMFTFVGIAHLLDKYLLGGTEASKTVVCCFYISTEGVSIIENADQIGIPIPHILKEKFLQLREREHKREEERKEQEGQKEKRESAKNSGVDEKGEKK